MPNLPPDNDPSRQDDELPTIDSPSSGPGSTGHSGSESSSAFRSSSVNESARYQPGHLVNERYRITGFIGKGGMGEVYRADDIKLHQEVALKFLPSALAADPVRLQKFHAEVRTARQVSHRSVCRVYDISETSPEAGGEPFISMEYVDGEDLASLLRRIGRLPGDKAVDISRQICAGVAAAHDAGVLHRDLKPANIMLDGQGNVRITDFGLAGVAEEIAQHEVTAGTPAYMAPEQIEGREVTPRSDIYSLGMVLYEIFTGKRPFEASTPGELRAMYQTESQTPSMGASSPSSVVPDVDPAVERVIMRCLEWDPARRPDTAIAVAAALPGGDPLAAALAAGETPSPELVAQSGRSGAMKPTVAGACAAVIALCVVALLAMGSKGTITALYPVRESPLVWAEKARDVARGLEIVEFENGFDEAWGYIGDGQYRFWLMNNFLQAAQAEKQGLPIPEGVYAPEARWGLMSDPDRSSFGFFYRWSPRTFEHLGVDDTRITFFQPPLLPNNEFRLTIDARGRLTSLALSSAGFHDRRSPDDEVGTDEIWNRLFELAGMDRDQFVEEPPRFVPDLALSDIAAWRGPWVGGDGREVVVHAAALHGKPVYFRIFTEWNYAALFEEEGADSDADASAAASVSATPATTFIRAAIGVLNVLIPILLFGGGVSLAWRNWRLNRFDRKGMLLVFLTLIIALILVDFFSAHQLLPTSQGDFGRRLTNVIALPAIASLFYMALEPYARKLWPETLISWSRLATGRWRDPRLGRDLLIGVTVGALLAAVSRSMIVYAPAFTGVPRMPAVSSGVGLLGTSDLIGQSLSIFSNQVQQGFVFFLFLILIKGIFRLRVLAVLVFATIIGFFVYSSNAAAGHELPALIFTLFSVSLFVGVMLIFGVVALITVLFATSILSGVIDFDFAAWYAHVTITPLVIIGAISAFGFYTATGGQSLFKDDVIGA